MRIKYEAYTYVLKTKCPYKEDVYPDAAPRVGSAACRNCKYFKGIYTDKQEVECTKE